MHRYVSTGLLLVCSAGAAGQAVPAWTPITAVDLKNVEGMIVHDEDGSGPIEPYLVASGGIASTDGLYPFRRHGRSAWLPVDGVARFDGYRWAPMGGGLYNTSIESPGPATSFVSGGEPGTGHIALVATGGFERTGGEPLSALGVFDANRWRGYAGTFGADRSMVLADLDGPGTSNAILVTSAVAIAPLPNPVFVEVPAAWDGRSWRVLGGGVLMSPNRPVTRAYVAWDEDGDGPDPMRLFMGGTFERAGTHWAHNVCRWDGEQLTALGGGPGVSSGPGSSVHALEVFDDDGPGPRGAQLYALGSFDTVYDHGNARTIVDLARWDGKQWSSVPGWNGIGNTYDMAVFDDDGPGPNKEALFIGGLNPTADGVTRRGIIKWDGTRWHSVGDGLIFPGFAASWAKAMCVYDDDGPGPNPGGLYVGGLFYEVGGQFCYGFARWGIPLPEPCYADCDRAGTGYRVLDIFDFLCFQTRFAAGDPYACDADTSTGPRVCDLFDFLYFQNAFAAGCP